MVPVQERCEEQLWPWCFSGCVLGKICTIAVLGKKKEKTQHNFLDFFGATNTSTSLAYALAQLALPWWLPLQSGLEKWLQTNAILLNFL